MKIKNRLLMVILLSTMTLLILIGSIGAKRRKEGPEIKEDPTPVISVMPDSFLGKLDDSYNVPEAVMKVIIDYMDAYYKSLYTLEVQDTSALFTNEMMADISDKAIRTILDHRKMFDFDFSLNAAHYDLKVFGFEHTGNSYKVCVYEDDHFSFKFLNGIESSAYDIDSYFTIAEKEGAYKIDDLVKYQGYYLALYEGSENIADVERKYDYYSSELKDMFAYNEEVLKVKAASKPYSSAKTFRIPYDREAAVAYADKYCHARNREWYNFTDEGGNCQNYASQSLLAGGMQMDYSGDLQWKCYVEDPDYEPEINGEETEYGRTRSWVGVDYFYNYALNNEGYGLVCDVNANLYYAQPGDLIIVGNGSLSHTMIISKIVDGHILVHSNSIDMKDYPLEGFTYLNVVLIKILGCN
ncbi:MAG: amidase domain-containing protein [Erysipelotrichaceae bacterium]|nr:amidase domain-containing protein [Erysipelotrichaceae bacterium]